MEKEFEDKVKFFMSELEQLGLKCEDKADLIILSNIMMGYTRKCLGIGLGCQELADAQIFDHINAVLPISLKTVV
jgi:hypothetical protein